MPQARLEHNNFTAGEISPWLRNRTQLERYARGVKLMRNMVLIPEGGATRRPGTAFIRALRDESETGALISFRYSGAGGDSGDSYMLVLNDLFVRFIRDGAYVLSAGIPYEVAIPWTASDLANVRWAQEGNAMYVTCRGFEPRKLIRGASHTDWTLSLYRPSGGPVKVQNLDHAKTILASATTGTVTLLGVGTPFAAGHVGSVWRLDESDLALIANWKASEAVTIATEEIPVTGSTIGNYTNPGNAYDNNTGTSATRAASTSGFIGRSYASPSSVSSMRVRGARAGGANVIFRLMVKNGSAPALSTDGTELGTITIDSIDGAFDVTMSSSNTVSTWDHIWVRWTPAFGTMTVNFTEIDATRFTPGGTPVLRRYNGNVYQAIAGTNTGVAPPTHTEGDVLSETGGVVWRYRHGPYGFVRITAVASATEATAEVLTTLPDSVTQTETYRWWEGAWNGIDGWPEGVLLVDRGLLFWRGRDFWITTVDDDDDFEVTALEDSAIAATLRSRDGAMPLIEWALDNGVIVLGCRDNEVLVRSTQTYEPLTIGTLRAPIGSKKGSAAHVPAALEDGTIFIGRSRERLFYAAFDPDTQKLEPAEVSLAGRHLLVGQASKLAWQPDPWNVLWVACSDGSLVALTFNREHQIAGMHQHPMTNGEVEAIAAIPSSDEAISQVYAIVQRTIAGAPRRYTELLGEYFAPSVDQVTASGAWFFDSAGSYSGSATAVITGLDHLTGEEVGILANNAAHNRKTVATNIVLRSEEFDNASWSKTMVTVTANAALAPEDTLTADKLVETAGSGSHHITQGVAVGAVAHTFSVRAKAGERTWLALAFTTGTSNFAFFNLATGAVGTVDAVYGATATISAVGDGWYRCSITRTATATTWFAEICVASADNTHSYAGVAGAGVFVSGAQLEAGVTAARDYIPTTTAAASGVRLDRSDVTSAVIGLPIDAQIVDLPRNIVLPQGSSKGEKKRASHCIVDVVESIGGSLSINGGRAEPLQLTGTIAYGTPPALFTGAKRAQLLGPLKDEIELAILASDGMPLTVTGLAPELDITED